ncbi:MAG: SH3 domain-containing protein [Chloroflexota bacterium]
MVKQLTGQFISLIFVILLVSACGNTASRQEALEPFDRALWPTPETETEASNVVLSTPFPRVDEALSAAVQAKAEAQRAGQRSTPARFLDETPADENQASANEVPAETSADDDTETETINLNTDEADDLSDDATLDEPTNVEQDRASGRVISVALNVRSGPETESDVLFTVNQGDVLTLIPGVQAESWVLAEAEDGRLGWVNSDYLSFDDSDEVSTPVATNIEAPIQSQTGDRLLIQPRSGQDVMIINRDGSGLKTITSGIDPVLSPDGNQIAFTRWSSGDIGQLWVANSDGSGERMILGGMRKVKSPSWSPDSERISVNFQKGGTIEVEKQCQAIDRGEPDINFWQAYDVELEFSADGIPVRLCWRLPPDPHWRLRVINLNTAEFEDLPSGQYAFAPTWDPANDWRIVSVDRFGLVWTDVNRGVAEPLTNDGADRGPIFSADGRFIAVTYKQDDHWEVHRLNADGTGRVRLTKTPLYAIVDSPQQWNNASPVFSPDGSEIAFLTDRNGGRWEVWIMNTDGSNQRPLFSDEIQAQLAIEYEGNDARMLGWGQ